MGLSLHQWAKISQRPFLVATGVYASSCFAYFFKEIHDFLVFFPSKHIWDFLKWGYPHIIHLDPCGGCSTINQPFLDIPMTMETSIS